MEDLASPVLAFVRDRCVVAPGHRVDPTRNVIVVDASTEVGVAAVRVYAGLLIREFGDETFHVRRVETRAEPGKADGRAA